MSTDLEMQVQKSLEKVKVAFSGAALKNAALNEKEKKAQKLTLTSHPIRLRIELTNECNLRCIFCYKSYFNVEKEHLSMGEFKKLDPFLRSAKFLTFFTKSEPLLAENLFPAIEHCKDIKAVTYFSTNAIPLTREISEKLVDLGLTFLQVSVNVFGDQYAKVYRGGTIERLEENLKTLSEVKKAKGSDKPHLRLSFCSTKDSVANLDEAIRFAKKHQFSQGVQITPLFAVGDDQKDKTYEADPEFFESYYQRGAKLAGELGVPFWIISDPRKQVYEDPFCYDPWESINIEPNGDVYPCSVSTEVMGNVTKQSIEEIWNGKRYQEFRSKVNTTGPEQNSDCKTCLNCHLHNLKSASNSAIERKAMSGGYYRIKQAVK